MKLAATHGHQIVFISCKELYHNEDCIHFYLHHIKLKYCQTFMILTMLSQFKSEDKCVVVNRNLNNKHKCTHMSKLCIWLMYWYLETNHIVLNYYIITTLSCSLCYPHALIQNKHLSKSLVGTENVYTRYSTSPTEFSSSQLVPNISQTHDNLC